MTDLSADIALSGRRHIAKAVYQHGPLSAAGLSERLFALLFSGLVYPQIWEDPELDMEAMALGEGHRVVTIASGGCNVMSYLTRAPGRIDAVDLNRAHVALNRLKLEAVRRLPSQGDFFRFFGATGFRHNAEAYARFVAPHLDREARRYWEGRDLAGRRRIAVFDRDFYRTGLLGLCIAMGHAVARLHGVNPAGIMEAKDLREQRIFFAEQLGPLFDRRFVRWATSKKASLFGLGIPPAQYEALAGGESMADVLRERVRKLACDFPLKTNYFAWQAFARHYPKSGEAALPPYLEARHFETLRAHAGRVAVHQANFTEFLAGRPAASVDRYVLLDAQDWMSDAQLDALWTEITRTAAPGARVIFRTAAMPTLLPGRVSAGTLDAWRYEEEASAGFTARDRSAIYGGFHLYVKKD
jgi:S-adenosylmethionine-diacylglycerol 3-amino-3-carboxypropyl transferase